MIKIHKVPNRFDSDRGFQTSQILDLFDLEFVSDFGAPVKKTGKVL